jgi:excisionase family DNA binding protein
MAKLINNKVYLSPFEASAVLGISYKTLERWVDAGGMNVWAQQGARRKRVWKRLAIKRIVTPTGYRLYEQASIDALRNSFEKPST